VQGLVRAQQEPTQADVDDRCAQSLARSYARSARRGSARFSPPGGWSVGVGTLARHSQGRELDDLPRGKGDDSTCGICSVDRRRILIIDQLVTCQLGRPTHCVLGRVTYFFFRLSGSSRQTAWLSLSQWSRAGRWAARRPPRTTRPG
jgi:hypothetical protein